MGNYRFDVPTCYDTDLVSTTFISLAFTNQKTLSATKSSASDSVAAPTDAKINVPFAERKLFDCRMQSVVDSIIYPTCILSPGVRKVVRLLPRGRNYRSPRRRHPSGT